MTEPASRSSGSRITRHGLWLLLVIPLAIGIVIGHDTGYRISYDDNGLAGVGGFVEAAALVFILGIAGLVALLRRSSRGALMAFAGAGLVVVGAYGAAQLTVPLGFGYRAPVVLEAAGHATFELDGVATFVPNATVAMTCASLGDSTATGSISGLDLGELGAGTLRGSLSLDPAAAPGHLELFIDGGDLAEGATQPFWEGEASVHDLSTDAKSGTADFVSLAYTDPGVMKGLPAATDGSWPATLSGTLHWDCRS